MGQPKYPSALQVAQLEEASSLVAAPHTCHYDSGTIRLEVSLPPQAVAAITVELAPPPAHEGTPA
jgi:hypothetical protein